MNNILNFLFGGKKINYEIQHGGAYCIDAFLLDDMAKIKKEVAYSIANKQIKKNVIKKKGKENE